MAQKVRVAAVQFGAGTDVQANLQTCLRMIDEAAKQQPQLMVLPEFCNHASWYDNKEHCYNVSVPLDGEFLQAVAAKAAEHQCYIVINVTVQHANGTVTGTSILYDPQGQRLAMSDKQVLMGHENDFLQRAQSVCPIVETPFGRIAMYACMDGVINETPRGLALRGAHILCNSLNSFARDEAALHVPVRAPENRVFIVAANKVAPLIPEFLLEPVSQATNIPVEFLHGAGESQIVAPDGTVLAKAPRTGDAVVIADIDVSEAEDKTRPDGTDVFAARRPALYSAIAQPPQERHYTPGAAEMHAAVFQPPSEGAAAIEEAAAALSQAASVGAQLLVLPELFCFENGRVSDAREALMRSQAAIDALSAACKAQKHDIWVVTSLAQAADGGYAHVGLLIGRDGLRARQPQLHRSARHAAWVNVLGDYLQVQQLPFGRLALIVGDDALYPETFRLAALQNAEIAAVPTHLLEKWELETGLRERSAENRLCLVVASRPTAFGASALMTLHADFTLMTPWKTRPFDGNISTPLVTAAAHAPGLTHAAIHPANAQNRFVSHRTDVVDGRPWYLTQAITG
ncbi:MAG: carbon-nitrogen hydrolase family protein [Chloroflexi bacterium]|nr:carbon-nitrogen hydrolase family protein [Chloroflexota bacterium]